MGNFITFLEGIFGKITIWYKNANRNKFFHFLFLVLFFGCFLITFFVENPFLKLLFLAVSLLGGVQFLAEFEKRK
jgi:hypothetical protein